MRGKTGKRCKARENIQSYTGFKWGKIDNRWKTREKARKPITISFGFASYWLKKKHFLCSDWLEPFRAFFNQLESSVLTSSQLRTALQFMTSSASWENLVRYSCSNWRHSYKNQKLKTLKKTHTHLLFTWALVAFGSSRNLSSLTERWRDLPPERVQLVTQNRKFYIKHFQTETLYKTTL